MSEHASSSPETSPDLAAALHEVGNGLTVILGWLAEARARGEASGAVREAIEAALARAKRAQRIARRAIGADVSRASPERIDEVLSEAALGVVPALNARGIRLASDVSAALGKAQIESPDLLLQVLTNLLLNAIEVTPAGREIRVRAEQDEAAEPVFVVIDVRDSGPGIPDAARASLFVRGATTREDGAGIGLAHARALAISEGGALSLLPHQPDAGATFRLHWPLATSGVRSGPHTVRAHLLSGYRVALIEDDKQVIELLEMVFGARGATVSSFASLDDTLTALAGARFDVVLVDASPFVTPEAGVGGLGRAIERLRAAHPELSVVVISGAIDPGPLTGVTWIRKPFDVEELVEVVRLFPRHGVIDKG